MKFAIPHLDFNIRTRLILGFAALALALAGAFEVFNAASYGARLAAKVDATRNAVAQLDDKRAQVSDLSIVGPHDPVSNHSQ